MRIIPVLDVSRGIAVHARAGDRPRYRPARSVLAPGADGDALALARAYREVLGATECYVADLDAIQGGARQRELLGELARPGTGFAGTLLVDAGVHRPGDALELLASGASGIVAGLECLRAFSDLAAMVELAGRQRVVFSLDLRLGTPVTHPALRSPGAAADALGLAARAVDAGASCLLVLDVGRVGTGCGVDLGLVEALRRRFPAQRLLAGGGVRTSEDLERMRDAGCDGALVATAIHTGAIGAADIGAPADPGAEAISRPRAPRGSWPTGRSSLPPPAPAG